MKHRLHGKSGRSEARANAASRSEIAPVTRRTSQAATTTTGSPFETWSSRAIARPQHRRPHRTTPSRNADSATPRRTRPAHRAAAHRKHLARPAQALHPVRTTATRRPTHAPHTRQHHPRTLQQDRPITQTGHSATIDSRPRPSTDRTFRILLRCCRALHSQLTTPAETSNQT